MAAELRKTEIGAVGDLPWGAHFCHFYETESDLLSILLPYFQAGLENNEFYVWVTFAPLDAVKAAAALRRTFPEADRHLLAGHIEILPHTEWYLKDGAFNVRRVVDDWRGKLAQALAQGYAGMRVNTNRAWLRTGAEWADFAKYEKWLDELTAEQPMVVSCAYPLSATGAAEIFDAAHAHQFALVRRQSDWEVLETPELQQATTEIKRLNDELERLVAERTGELTAANERLKREVAEREQAEESQRASRLKYESLVLSIDGIVWELDVRADKFTFVCLKAESILGYPPERWLDERNFWSNHLYPDDREWVVAHCAEAAARMESHQLEYRMIAADGREVWFRDIATVGVAEDGSVRARGVMVDITEGKLAEDQLRANAEQLRALMASLTTAREVESTRIAREIHDELGSALTGLKWELESSLKLAAEPADAARLGILRGKVEAMMGLVDNTIGTVRRISSELRPVLLDDLGVGEAIKWQSEQFEARTGIACRCDCPLDNPRLSWQQATALFRIVQEALTNILRHAEATTVDIPSRRRAAN